MRDPAPGSAPDVPDGILAGRAMRGDTDAFGDLVRRYQASVFNVCYRLLGERGAAEDLAQDAFLRAYQRLSSYDAARPFGPWIRRVAANLCLNHLEQRPPAALELDDELDAASTTQARAHDPAAAAEDSERSAVVRRAILALPARYRIVIELRHFQDLSYVEMATLLNRPLSDIKSDLFRARRLLAQVLPPER